MGKTLGSILAIGAAIAVNVIPGVGQFLSAAIGSTLATAVISSVTLYGLQAGVSLIAGSGSQKPDTTETAIKTSRPPRVSAYGTSRLYGAYVLYETASNGTAVDVYAVHDGRLDGIVARYLGDEQVTLSGTTVNAGSDGRYKGGAVSFYTTDGSVPGAGLPAVTALIPEWQGRGDGVVAMAVTAKSVKAKDFQEVYPQSAVPVPSLVARWQRCPDPAAANPLDESGWTWTENPVRQLLHYKLVREGPRPHLPRSHANYAAQLAALRAKWWARKIAPTLQYWIDAAADCDAPRALKAGGTEPRYRSAVAHKHTDQHKGPISALLATFDGWLAPRADGALVIYSGRIYPADPADLIGSDEIVSYTWEGGRIDDGEAVNEVICSYVSAEHDYNSVECDAWRDETDITERGQVLSSPLDVQVPSHAQVRFLAKRLIARKNSRMRGTVTTNIAGRKVQGKRFIPLHLEEAGTVFYSGPAEIIALTRNIRGGVTFQWVAVDPNVDLWNAAVEEGEPAAKGNRVASQPLEPPAVTSATWDGKTLRVEATGPEGDDITWFMQQRAAGSAVWGEIQEFPDTDPGPPVAIETTNVPAGADVELQVQYQVGDGRYSPWSDPPTTLSTAPIPAEPWEDMALLDMVDEGDGVLRATNWHGIAFSGPYSEDVEIEVNATANTQVAAWGVSSVDPAVTVTPGDTGQRYVDIGMEKAADDVVYGMRDTGDAATGAYTVFAGLGSSDNVPWKFIYRHATGNVEFFRDGVSLGGAADEMPDGTPVWLLLHIIVPESVIAGASATVLYAGPVRE